MEKDATTAVLDVFVSHDGWLFRRGCTPFPVLSISTDDFSLDCTWVMVHDILVDTASSSSLGSLAEYFLFSVI